MARLCESGIDYFPLNVGTVSNNKIKLLYQDHGASGFWIWNCLLSEIYKQKGYFLNIKNDDLLTLFASDVCKCKLEIVKNVVRSCIKRELFNQLKYQTFGILTSDRIQENYLEATARRKRIILIKEYLLIDFPNTSNYHYVNINGENANISEKSIKIYEKNGNINLQSRLKESKENKIRENVLKLMSPTHDIPSNILDSLLFFLRKNIKTYYNREILKQTDELNKFVIKNDITEENLKTDPVVKALFLQEDERIYCKYILKAMATDIEDCYAYYSRSNFTIKCETITSWDGVLHGWMKRKPEFEIHKNKFA